MGPSKGETVVVFNKPVTNVRNAYDISTGESHSPSLMGRDRAEQLASIHDCEVD